LVVPGVPELVPDAGRERDALARAREVLLPTRFLVGHRAALDGQPLLLEAVDVHRRPRPPGDGVAHLDQLAALVVAAAHEREPLASTVVDRVRVVGHVPAYLPLDPLPLPRLPPLAIRVPNLPTNGFRNASAIQEIRAASGETRYAIGIEAPNTTT